MIPVNATAMTVRGVAARPVGVTAQRSSGQPALTVTAGTGRYLPETRDRIRAGLINAGFALPVGRVSVQLSADEPADIPSACDLAAAAAILALAGRIPAAVLDQAAMIGEIGLDGAVRPVRGALIMTRAAAEHGRRTVVVPSGNAGEAALIPGVQVVAVGDLAEFVAWAISGDVPAQPGASSAVISQLSGRLVADLLHVPAAMTFARYGVEVAAAGGHHLSLTGPVGSAKLLLATSVPTLLPDLDDDTAAEVSDLYSLAGQPPAGMLIRRPPVQVPHSSISLAALIGGRRPGAITLAHRGVLLLDDGPEFSSRALAGLRQPLRTGTVTLARARGVVTYPAQFQLVTTSKPCPCTTTACTCTTEARRGYQARLAALGDRSAITLPVTAPGTDALAAGESSAQAAARVARARAAAAQRLTTAGYRVNGDVPLADLTGRFRLPKPIVAALTRRIDRGALTLRGFASVLRVAWTVSDLRGTERPDQDAIDTALSLYEARTA
jgi:magnesium chelatase family protein